MKIGRTPGGQYQLGQAVSREDLRAGDLVFFRPRSGNRVGHVGIVTEADGQGNFKFIHASIKGVKITNFEGTNYYTARYIGARRLL
jgi:cell wall-associated NlpC family hydrolase